MVWFIHFSIHFFFHILSDFSNLLFLDKHKYMILVPNMTHRHLWLSTETFLSSLNAFLLTMF